MRGESDGVTERKEQDMEKDQNKSRIAISMFNWGPCVIRLKINEEFQNKLLEEDFIEIEGGIAGYVSSVGWRSTKIRDRFNNLVIIPNSKMAESVVTNFYSPETAINLIITSGVAYEEDLEKVEKVVYESLNALIKTSEYVALDTEPRFGFSEFGDSNINFWVFMQAKDWPSSFQLKSEIIKIIHKNFEKNNIVINYPTRRIINDK